MNERDVFLNLLDLPDALSRSQYLDRACANNPVLRARLDSLVRSHETAGDFLEFPAVPRPSPAGDSSQLLTDEDTLGSRKNSIAATLRVLEPAERSDSLGRLGAYEVVEVLGQGGFGVVFRAFDEALQRSVAIKVLSPVLAATTEDRARFLRGARGQAAVRHENVVQVYVVHEQPSPHLVMELICGETLEQRLERTGPLTTAEILRIAGEIADGLAAAHRRGLIHRDIKPANILLEADQADRVKLADFGLARLAADASQSQSGIVAGTPMYMAPEQIRGETIDHRADLFSLGSVMYKMCTGRAPFRASSVFAVLKSVAEETPQPIRELAPEVPQWLSDCIVRLQNKNPDDRYRSAAEVADLLKRWQIEPPDDTAPSPVPNGPVPHGPGADSQAIASKRRPLGPRSRLVFAALLLLAALGLSQLARVTDFGRRLRRLPPHGTQPRENPPDGRQIAPTPEPTTPGVTPPETASAGRQAAEWLRSLAPVRVDVIESDNQPYRTVFADEPLPDGPFRLTGVRLNVAKIDELGDRLIEELAVHLDDVRLLEVQVPGSLSAEGLRRIVHLPCFADVTYLAIDTSEIDDAVFDAVRQLSRLRNLELHRCPRVTGEGSRTLKSCVDFDTLALVNMPITAAGLEELAELPKLNYLNLSSLEWTPAHLAALAKLNLGQLAIARSGIDDATAEQLAQRGGAFTRLNVAHNPITDRALLAFKKLKHLVRLDIRGTRVSAEGIADLQAALPDCEILSQ